MGLALIVPCFLLLAFGLRALGQGSLQPLLVILGVGAAGVLLLKDSFGEQPKSQWVYGLTTLMFGYWGWNGISDAWSSFHGLGLRSLANTSAELFTAWCCLLCMAVLTSMMEKKPDFAKSTSLPVVSTSWALGVVATLSGLNSLFSMRLDGFIGTLSTLGFTVLIIGLGVMLVKGKMAHLACYGLGLVTAASTIWTLLTNDLLHQLAYFTQLPFYGILLSAAFVALLGTWVLGTEVARAQAK